MPLFFYRQTFVFCYIKCPHLWPLDGQISGAWVVITFLFEVRFEKGKQFCNVEAPVLLTNFVKIESDAFQILLWHCYIKSALACIFFFRFEFVENEKKSLGSAFLGKKTRVGRVTWNTKLFFLGLKAEE